MVAVQTLPLSTRTLLISLVLVNAAQSALADCAAAPSLYYADRIVPLRAGHPVLGAYLNRLEARPSFARVLREMQPWWQNFPFADGPLAS